MANRIEDAKLLTSLWLLGGERLIRMPTSHGILDRALLALQARLPEPLRSSLTFSNTSVGLRCLELPAILLAAQEALLTSEPNPTYLATDVMLDEDGARQIVLGADLSTRQARELGGLLRSEVDRVKQEIGGVELEPIAA